MFKQIDYVMITVSNMARSVDFYKNTLGLPLKFDSPDWSEFDTGNTILALHGGGKPSTRSSGGGPSAGMAEIGFYVEDLDTVFSSLKSKGANFAMAPTVRAEERIKLAILLDPDGLQISIAEQMKREHRPEAMAETPAR